MVLESCKARRMCLVAICQQVEVGAKMSQIEVWVTQAHLIKVKLPSGHIELEENKKVYEAQRIPRETLVDRVRHVVQSAFNGRRIVIFSGGPKEDDDQVLFEEARAIRAGGGFGSIVGRNVFQREKAKALSLLNGLMEIYK